MINKPIANVAGVKVTVLGIVLLALIWYMFFRK